MSIDRAVGGMEKYLLNLDTNATYNKIRFKVARWLEDNGHLSDRRRKGIIRLNNAIKSVLSHQQNIFEGMNIRYFGPFDGHDIKEVVRLLGLAVLVLWLSLLLQFQPSLLTLERDLLDLLLLTLGHS